MTSQALIVRLACPLLAQCGHRAAEFQCPLLEAKRTFAAWSTSSSAIDALRLAYFYALMPLEDRAVLMGVLVVICPETGKKFSTGIQIDRDDLYTIHRIRPHPRAALIASAITNGITETLNG